MITAMIAARAFIVLINAKLIPKEGNPFLSLLSHEGFPTDSCTIWLASGRYSPYGVALFVPSPVDE